MMMGSDTVRWMGRQAICPTDAQLWIRRHLLWSGVELKVHGGALASRQ